MKKFFQKVFNILNINRRDFVIFMLALLLAFSIWLVHNLSLNYTNFVSTRIIAQTNIEYRSELSTNSCVVSARVRTTGYNLLRLSYRKSDNSKIVEFPSSVFHHYSNDVFYTTTQELQEYAEQIFGEKARVDFLIADTLKFEFPRQEYKTVPVKPVKVISTRSQYMLTEDLVIEPDSVIVFGDEKRLESIDYILTEPISVKEASSSIYGEAFLKEEKGLRLSIPSVQYSAEVTRFIEVATTLPLYVRNVPSGKELKCFPSNVDVTFLCTFPVRSNPETSVVLYVDYQDYIKSLSGKCRVNVSGIDSGILDYTIEPSSVLCFSKDSER